MDLSIEEIIGKAAGETGVDRAKVATGVGIIADFVKREAPKEVSDALFAKFPGLQALAAEHVTDAQGLFGVFNSLSASGLSMSEIPEVAMSFVRQIQMAGGKPEIDAVVKSIPGLAQFI